MNATESVLTQAALEQFLTNERTKPGKATAQLCRRLEAVAATLDTVRTSALAEIGQEVDRSRSRAVLSTAGDEMLDVKQVMKITGKSESTSKRLCKRIGRKVSGRWVVHRTDLEQELSTSA